jgi:general secretion pathway protein I
VAGVVRASLLNRARRRARRPAEGFTLIEVLVALFVFAIALTALVQAGTHRADNLGYLRDRTLASWIASDRVTVLRLMDQRIAPGTREGTVELAGRTWHWEAEIKATADEAVRRVEVAVRPDSADAPLANVTGFLGDPKNRASTGPSP